MSETPVFDLVMPVDSEGDMKEVIELYLEERYPAESIRRGEIMLDSMNDTESYETIHQERWRADVLCVGPRPPIAIECKYTGEIREALGQALGFELLGYEPVVVGYELAERQICLLEANLNIAYNIREMTLYRIGDYPITEVTRDDGLDREPGKTVPAAKYERLQDRHQRLQEKYNELNERAAKLEACVAEMRDLLEPLGYQFNP